jgi:hypothetical protein
MNEEEERPKPNPFRVVDKRISARPSGEETEASPSSAEVAPPPQPQTDQSPPRPAQPATPPVEAPQAAGEEPIWTPEQEAEAQRFLQEIAQRPSLEWVVNSAVTLANVAGTKLDLGQTADAELAIDALAALAEKLGPRLGQAEAPLRQTLAQLQLAYANRAAGVVQPPAGP